MALRQTKKISELTALESASLQTTLLGVDNGTTYKVTLDVLEDAIINMVSRSTDLRLDALESYTASVSSSSIPLGTISSSTQISNFGFISSSHTDITQLNSFTSSQNTLNSAFTTGINARLQTSSFNDFSASVHLEIIAATNEQSFNGLISGSSQLTSSYDSRYVLSGSITQTTWDNITNKPNGIVSQSTDLSSLNTFTASYFTDSASVDSRVDALELFSSSLNSTFATDLEVSIVSSSVAATIGVISQNTGLVSTSSFNSYTASISTASLVTSITNLNSATSSFETKGSGILSGSVSYTSLTNIPSGIVSQSTDLSQLNLFTQSIDSRVDNLELNTGSYLTSLNGTISSSAQITTLGFVSGSYETTGRGIISSSANLVTTSSFNTFTSSVVTSDSIDIIQTITSASYAALTPVSGTLYIIIG